MALPPVICDEECHNKRIHLYWFYSSFLASLVLLALLHFVFFLASRRKSKYAAREYASRKLEFFSGIPPDLTPTDKENAAEKGDHKIEDDNDRLDFNQTNISMSPEPSTSSSTSALNRIMSVNGIGSVPLQRIDEESMAASRQVTPINRDSSSSSCSASTSRGDRTLIGALQEPVIVTVATVSALFQQHEITEPNEQRSRSHSSESMSSVLDISDLVNSPGRSTTTRPENEEYTRYGGGGDWGAGAERGGGLHTKHQMLDVRFGGGKGGFLKSHRGGKGDALSTDAIFPVSDSGGIYDTDHIA